MSTVVEKSEILYVGTDQSSKAASKISFGNRWRVKKITYEDVVNGLAPQCDFLWLNLGKMKTAADGYRMVSEIASLRDRTSPKPFVFISGSTTNRAHGPFVERIYRFFAADLNNLQVDLAGKPDVLSALAKCIAIKSLLRPTSATLPAPRIKVPNADLRSENGRLSVRPISELFGVAVSDIGQWIGSNKAALSKTPDALSIQEPLHLLVRVAGMRDAVGGGASFRQWLRTPHPMLVNKTPLHWIETGKALEIAEFVGDALTGQPS